MKLYEKIGSALLVVVLAVIVLHITFDMILKEAGHFADVLAVGFLWAYFAWDRYKKLFTKDSMEKQK